jgi:hypothetical protein
LLEPNAADRSYATLAKLFHFEKPSQATAALRVAKRVFRRKLKDVLIEFGAIEGDLDAKVTELKKIFEN